MAAVKPYPDIILPNQTPSVITNSVAIGHHHNNYETISVIKSGGQQRTINSRSGPSAIVTSAAPVIAKRSVINTTQGGINSSSVFSYGGNGQQPQQQGQAQTQQQQAVVVGQLATTNAKGEMVLANLDLNSQPVSYQILEVPVTSGGEVKNFQILAENVSLQSTDGGISVNVDSNSQGTISPDENSQDTDSLDLEVVTSSVDSVLLRNIKNGALYRTEVIKTMVSANGHVLKTVKGKAIGEVQIVDDKANVAVERAHLEAKKRQKTGQTSSIFSHTSQQQQFNGTPTITSISQLSQDGTAVITSLNQLITNSGSADQNTTISTAAMNNLSLTTLDPVNLDLPVFTTLTPSTTTIESDTAFVTVTVGAAGDTLMQPSVLHHTADIQNDDIPESHVTSDDTRLATPSLPLNLSMGGMNSVESPIVQFTYHQEDGSVVLTPSVNFHGPEDDIAADMSPAVSPVPVPKAKKKRKSDEDNTSRECQVCKGVAGRHSYYGGQACTSCRAFFRRSVISESRYTYFCVKEGKCEVNFKTRRQCQYCRFNRCLEAGMRPSWVDPKVGDKPEDPDEPPEKKPRGTGGDSEGDMSDAEGGDKLKFITESEINFIESLVQSWEYSTPNKANDIDTGLIREIITLVAFDYNLSKVGFEHLIGTLKRRLNKAAAKIGDMNKIIERDRVEILEHNVPLLVKLCLSLIINPNLTWDKQLEGLLGTDAINKLKESFAQKKGYKDVMKKKLKYEQFFSCLGSEHDMEREKESLKIMEKIASWPADEKEFVLMSMMILFNSHSLSLQDSSRIDDIQAYIGEVMHNYLSHRCGKLAGRSKFVTGVYLINKCQHLHSLTYHKILIK